MDQKHAMLYPDPNAMPVEQRSSAAAAIGLPVEPPPTYDAATRQHTNTPTANLGWQSQALDIHYPTSSHYSPHLNHHQLPVIVEQANIPLPTNQQQQQQQQQQAQPVFEQQQQQPVGMPITTQPTATDLTSKLGPNPSTVTCPNCGVNRTTRMSYTPNTKTHLSALLLGLVGWCCCACIVPYCMNSCRTGNHYCSNCNAFLGAYNTGSKGSHRRQRRRRRINQD